MENDSSIPRCPQCGTPIAAADAQGLCPRCLMAGAAGPSEPAERWSPPEVAEVAAVFPQLEVLEMIGQGGMGAVFKVRQPKLERFAALKLLPESLARDHAFAGRFEREARLLARLSHPNIVSVFDYGQAGGYFYLLMEYVDGANLRQATVAGRFTPAQTLGVVQRICEALQFAHEEGVLHRDIKPENILIDTKGRVKLVDFGIAKLLAESEPGGVSEPPPAPSFLTQAGASLGTPAYMAPEQRHSPSEVDHRADIFSLGVVFYELLTGKLPPEPLPLASGQCGAGPQVDAIVRQALEPERERRQQSADELRTQVECARTAVSPPPPLENEPAGDPKLCRLAVVGAIWAGAGLVAGAALLMTFA